MLLYLIVAAVFAALNGERPLTQGKEEDSSIGFRKNDISKCIRSKSQELAFRNILASVVTL
jgi:hypothetical protein